jgi:hypothetical protein
MIKSLDELTKFLKICRKQGVTAISFEGLSVTLGELPKKNSDDAVEDEVDAMPAAPSVEELMNWSIQRENN